MVVQRLAVAAGALVLTACGGTSTPPVRQSGSTVATDAGIARPYGRGSSRVWVLTPKAGEPQSVVVFIHGWTATLPFEWHQAWLDHLLERGSTVVFPVYQTTGDEGELVTARLDLRAGLYTAFRVLRQHDLPVVVAGYSVGGALAFFYAADAPGWGVPRPAGVYSIFPADPLGMDPGLTHLGPPPRVQTLILVGDRDDTVGRYGADTFWTWLRPVSSGLKTYRLLHSNPKGLFFDHEAPTSTPFDAAMRRVFWQPLDELVARARRLTGARPRRRYCARMLPTFVDVLLARRQIAPYLRPMPVYRYESLSRLVGTGCGSSTRTISRWGRSRCAAASTSSRSSPRPNAGAA